MGAGGVAYLIKLKDTPDAYSGNAKKALAVNDAEDAVIFDKAMLPRDGTRMMTGDLDMGNHAIDNLDILNFHSFDAAIEAYADHIVELSNKARTAAISLRLAYLDSLTGISIGDGYMIQTDKVRARDGDGLALYEDGGAGIFIKDGGNVGIGTTSPTHKLDVEGSVDGELILAEFVNANTGSSAYSEIDLYSSAARLRLGVTDPSQVGWTGSSFIYSTDTNGRLALGAGNAEKVSILPSGNVGIGTTTAAAKLDVNGDVKLGGNLDMNDHVIKEATLDLGDLDNQEYRGFILTTQIAGESLSFGNQVYRASDNRLNKTDADTLSKTEGDLAIVLTTGTTAENGYVTILKLGSVKDTSWSFTIGAILYVSQTSGAITATEPSATGTFSRKIGYAQAANIVYFNPSHTILENG